MQKQGPASISLIARHVEENQVRIQLSDEIEILVTVDADAPPEVVLPKADSDDRWHYRSETPRTSKSKNGSSRWRQVIYVAPQVKGKLELTIPELKYREKGQEWRMVSWKPISVTVTTHIKDPDPNTLYPPAGIEELPPADASENWSFVIVSAIVLFCAILIALAVFIRLRNRGKKSLTEPPRETALRQLAELRSALPTDDEQRNQFITRLDQIVRSFLERKYQLPTLNQTTSEFVSYLSQADYLTKEEIQLLYDFLHRCDLAKFTPLESSRIQYEQDLDLAVSLVERMPSLYNDGQIGSKK